MQKTYKKIGLPLLALALASPVYADLLITEVVDGTLTGAAPKWIEISNTGVTDFTFGTGGGIIVQANAATDYIVDIDLSGVVIAAGATVTVSASNTGQDLVFQSVYGFAPDFTGGAATFGNGDDRYALAASGTDAAAGTLLDIYGEDGVDATPTGLDPAVWAYTDTYAYRVPGTVTGNAGIFDPENWVYGGINKLEAVFEADNSFDPYEIGLLQSYTTPGVYGVPVPAVPAGPAIVPAGADLDVTFASVVGLSYQLEASTDGMASWAPTGGTEISTGLPITLTAVGATPAAGEKIFYRVSVNF